MWKGWENYYAKYTKGGMWLFDLYEAWVAWQQGFTLVRWDRGAREYVSTGAWADKNTKAFSIGEAIFWPSKGAMRNPALLAHEMCHVRQMRKGPIRTTVAYWWHNVTKGYWDNPLEQNARRAERRVRAKKKGK